ncbi:MAG: tetratricopeptide repeat protein [Myxococcota bacterium]
MSGGETDVGGVAGSARPKKSGASVAELELAFAQDPQSAAYIPLCEAYLDQGRFMEAMVVAKKGLKAHPTSVESRLLLANVYAKQQKFPKALQEADEVVAANDKSAPAALGRAKIRLLSGDEKGAIQDLKKAIDLDPGADEATDILKARGIIYPEPPPPPPPPPPMMMVQVPGPPGRAPSVVGVPMPMAYGMPQTPPPGNQEGVPTIPPSRGASGVMPAMPIPGIILPPGFPPPRPRLEGEEELEQLANSVADQSQAQDKGGSAKTTLMLAVGGLLLVLFATGFMMYRKRVTEGIDDLTRSARASFLEDTYGSYQHSAKEFEAILENYDSKHGPTAANLAHADAILLGEHGDTDKKAALEKVLALAEKTAPESPHTISAKGLSILYSGDNRQTAAAAAYDAIWPRIQKLREGNQGQVGTFADLTLGIIDIELGNYQTAADSLSMVSTAMPQSVRAKVWYARAALRAGHLDKAEAGFSDALRASKDHPGARAGRALVRLQRGKLEGAAEDIFQFDDFAKKFPKQISDKDRALIEYARSEVYRAAGNTSTAEGAYQNAVRFDPTNADFPYGLGRNFLQNGRAKDALDPLRQAVKMEPNRKAFLISLADAETAVGDFGAAEKHVEAALKGDAKDLKAALAKGRWLAAQKKPEAETYLKEVLDWSKGNAEANLELGRYYHGVGKTKEARETLEQAVKDGTNLPSIRYGEILLSYGKLLTDLNEDGSAANTFKMAGEKGAIEAWFRLAQIIARNGRQQKDELKNACAHYISAGTSLPYSSEASTICAGL